MTKKIHIFVILSFIILLTNSFVMGKNMEINEPFYKVYFKTEGVVFGVVVNGFEVYFNNTGKSKSVEIPINQFVKSGENKLELQLHTWEENNKLSLDDSAYIDLEYRLYTGLKDYVVLNKLSYSEKDAKQGAPFINSSKKSQYTLQDNLLIIDKSGNYVISELNHSVDKKNYDANYIYHIVTMPTPFPEWHFLTSDTIPNPQQFKTIETMTKGLVGAPFTVLEKIHKGLADKDIESIMPLFKERNDEMDKAFYYTSGTYEKMLREAFEEEFSKGMILLDLDINIAKPMVSPGFKVVQLGSGPLIVFKNKSESVFSKYDIYFRKDGDEWIITR